MASPTMDMPENIGMTIAILVATTLFVVMIVLFIVISINRNIMASPPPADLAGPSSSGEIECPRGVHDTRLDTCRPHRQNSSFQTYAGASPGHRSYRTRQHTRTSNHNHHETRVCPHGETWSEGQKRCTNRSPGGHMVDLVQMTAGHQRSLGDMFRKHTHMDNRV